MLGDEVLTRRSVQWKVPVFMASYRTSISFDMQFLLEKKLFTGLFQESMGGGSYTLLKWHRCLGFLLTVAVKGELQVESGLLWPAPVHSFGKQAT